MRTTLNIEDNLIAQASNLMGVKEKTTQVGSDGVAYRKREWKEARQTRRHGEAAEADSQEANFIK
jgi:Arc/MetJ family transcription regulator